MKKRESYKLCQYPKNGYGDNNNKFYLINKLGFQYKFKNKYDKIIKERYWYIELPQGTFHGQTIKEITEILKTNEIDVKKW